jgi:RNA polymerase sigma-70 factor (ECF subfamily)
VRIVSQVQRARAGTAPLPADDVVVSRLRAGDERMFAALVDAWSPGMLRAARSFVSDGHTAEDVVQEAWLGVLRGIGLFQARSSLRTWAYRILLNIAKTRGAREARTVPMSSLGPVDDEHAPTVDPARFRGPDDRWPGGWRSFPPEWPSPEQQVVAAEMRRHLAAALAALPARQRVVVSLRDVHGYSSEEVCAMLDISPGNLRVLLHRGRASLRGTLEDQLTQGVVS